MSPARAPTAALAPPAPPLCDAVVLLRPWRSADTPAIVVAARDPLIRRFSHLPEPFDADAVTRWLERMPAELAVGSALRLIVSEARADDAVLGAIALFDIARDRRSAEIGYWLAAEARGRGLGARAVRLLSDWALGPAWIARVLASVDVGNDASLRLLRRCGYVAAGRRLRDGREQWLLERRGEGADGAAREHGAAPPG